MEVYMLRTNLKLLGLSLWVCLQGVVGYTSAFANQVKLDVSAGSGSILADKKQTIPLRISLTGFHFNSERERAPVNVAIVIDRSGSMSGDKIERAKEAATTAVELLGSNDIVSVITYDDSVDVLVPATKASERNEIFQAIRKIQPGGSTALFAGVSKGASEVRKFIDKEKVNRVILLSDGLANVGPSSPGELGSLGYSLIKEGVSVSTIGLGLDYNEDLMTRLADRSDGNHAFVERSADLTSIFKKEFRDILSVAAQNVEITIRLQEGFRPIRAIGRDVDIHGQTVVATLNQIYSDQEKYLLLEVEAPSIEAGRTKEIANVDVSYTNMSSKAKDKLSSSVGVTFTKSSDEVFKSSNKGTLEGYYSQLANENSQKAIQYRDEGRVDDAKKVLKQNMEDLNSQAQTYGLPSLGAKAKDYEQQELSIGKEDWNRERKSMREYEYKTKNQQQ